MSSEVGTLVAVDSEQSTVGPKSAPVGGPKAQWWKPTWRPKKNRVGLLVFLPPAILAGSLIANGAVQASRRGDATVQAERALKLASVKVPFHIRLPNTLPDNAKMVRVVLDEPDSNQGFQAYQLNVWYRTPGTCRWTARRGRCVRRLRPLCLVCGTRR